jgi:hypothetical protein
VNGSSKSDWATSVATGGMSLYVFGFGTDFESGTPTRLEAAQGACHDRGPGRRFRHRRHAGRKSGAGLDMPFKVVVSGGSLFLLMAGAARKPLLR